MRPITVAETTVFDRAAGKCMAEAERKALIDWIARNRTKGDRVPGTGGLRKVRFGIRDRGKSGALRVLYYYLHDNAPLYLITVWDKSDKLSLSDSEKAELKAIAKAIRAQVRNARSN